MYDAFYGLTQAPFGLSPDVYFCYRYRTYARAKAYMQYALHRGEGFAVVTGRPGIGKTTLIQDVIRDLGPDRQLLAQIDGTQLDADDLLRLVTCAFGLPSKGGVDKASLMYGLREHLIARTATEGTAILILDEAQNLTSRALEELRLITNLQDGPRPLVQILLVGQEPLRELTRDPSLEQVQQRIVAASHLEAMDLIETRAYIRHRLLLAGWSGHPVWEADALKAVYLASGGVPRLINKFCDRLLLQGSLEQRERLTGDDAEIVRGELKEEFLEGIDAPGPAGPSGQVLRDDLPEIDELGPEPLAILEASQAHETPGEQTPVGADGGARAPGDRSMDAERAAANARPASDPEGPARGVEPLAVESPEPELGPAGQPTPEAIVGTLSGSGSDTGVDTGGPADRRQGPALVVPADGDPAPGTAATSTAQAVDQGQEPPDVPPAVHRERRASRWPLGAAALFLLAIGGGAYVVHRGGLEAIVRGGGPLVGQVPDEPVDETHSAPGPDATPALITTTPSDPPGSPDPQGMGASESEDPSETRETGLMADAGPVEPIQPVQPIQSEAAPLPPQANPEPSPESIAAPPEIDSPAIAVVQGPEEQDSVASLEDTPVPTGVSEPAPDLDEPPPTADEAVHTPLATSPAETLPDDAHESLPRLAGLADRTVSPDPVGTAVVQGPEEQDSVASLEDTPVPTGVSEPAPDLDEPPPTADEAVHTPLATSPAETLPDDAHESLPRLAGLADRTVSPDPVAEPAPAKEGPAEEAPSDETPEVPPTPGLADALRGLGYEITEVEDGKLSLNLATQVPFAFDSATLPASAGGALTDLAEVLARNSRTRVTVVGHTDAVGPADYNRRLSLKRARAVEAYLRGRGVAQENLASLGMGEDVPLRLDGDPGAAVHQRRIELLLEPR